MTVSMKRRSLMKGIVWASPTAVVAVSAPAYASSTPATDVVLTGDAGITDECYGAAVSYAVDPNADNPNVTTTISVQTNNVSISYTGDNVPSVENLTATLYLNSASDKFDRFPDEIDVSNYGDEGSWSPFVRKEETQVNGQSFIVYESTYSGSFIAQDGKLLPVDAGWEWDDTSHDLDDVEVAQGPIVTEDPDSFNANKGALIFTASVDGAQTESSSASDALTSQGSALWVSRISTFTTCRYVGGQGQDDVVIPCEGYPGAPVPYPTYPGRPLQRDSSRTCEAMDAQPIRG